MCQFADIGRVALGRFPKIYLENNLQTSQKVLYCFKIVRAHTDWLSLWILFNRWLVFFLVKENKKTPHM